MTGEKSYIAVFRAGSSVRFKPEEGFKATFTNLPDAQGPVEVRARTRWVDEGHEAPAPRELWIDARGFVPNVDAAASTFGRLARHVATVAAFTANVASDAPEAHIIYDATPGATEREFVEVFLPDERGHIREGRIVNVTELAAVFTGLEASPHSSRIGRAIHQYSLALRYWYFGGEWLALMHLYMAVEALSEVAVLHSCERNNCTKEDLAERNGIQVTEGNWKHPLLVWARREVIFEGDTETYNKARKASDGVEHGFLELDVIYRDSLAVANATFGYVRSSILRFLNLPRDSSEDLYERPPRDVRSLRRFVRGHFVGNGDDPAQEGEEYPRLEWQSSIKTLTRDGDDLKLSFVERFTVRCAPTYSFKGAALEARGRAEPGQPPLAYERAGDLELETSVEPTSRLEEALAMMKRAEKFAETVHRASQSVGIPTFHREAFNIYVEVLSSFQAIELLIKSDRVMAGIPLSRSMFLGTCRLESIASASNQSGVSLRYELNSDRALLELYPDTASLVEQRRSRIIDISQTSGIDIPTNLPPIESTEFYRESQRSIEFAERVASASGFGGRLHFGRDDQGNAQAATRRRDVAFGEGVAKDAVDTLVAATVALAQILNWTYDKAVAADMRLQAQSTSEDAGQ